jgi:hypothetical protein
LYGFPDAVRILFRVTNQGSAVSIPLLPEFDAVKLRAAARRSKHAGQARRLLALAAVYEGATRTEAAKIRGPCTNHTDCSGRIREGHGVVTLRSCGMTCRDEDNGILSRSVISLHRAAIDDAGPEQ